MSNLQAILKSTEESIQSVGDPELRKIAFQEVLRHQLRSDGVFTNKPKQESGTASRKSKGRSSPTLKSSGQSAVRTEVEVLDLSPDEAGLAPWSTLPVDWKKFCWILEAARQKNLDGLTNSEISHLIDRIFRESKSPDVVNNLKVQIKKGMVKSVTIKSGEREYRVWKILAGGIKAVTVSPVGAE
jgi:hypothetical protein